MRRRHFLKLSAAGGLALGSAPFGLAASTGPAAASVVITDVSAAVDTGKLLAVLETFIGNGLWVSCALRLPDSDPAGFAALLGLLIVLLRVIWMSSRSSRTSLRVLRSTLLTSMSSRLRSRNINLPRVWAIVKSSASSTVTEAVTVAYS